VPEALGQLGFAQRHAGRRGLEAELLAVEVVAVLDGPVDLERLARVRDDVAERFLGPEDLGLRLGVPGGRGEPGGQGKQGFGGTIESHLGSGVLGAGSEAGRGLDLPGRRFVTSGNPKSVARRAA